MAAFVNVSRTILLGTAWTGTAPGPGVATPSGTISSPSDISGFVKGGAEPEYNAAMVDITNFGSLGYASVIPGLTSAGDITIDYNSDWAASQVGVIVRTTLGGIARPGSSPIYIDIKPTSAARSATNPSFVAAVYIKQLKGVAGSVGDRAAGSLVLAVSGTFTDLTS